MGKGSLCLHSLLPFFQLALLPVGSASSWLCFQLQLDMTSAALHDSQAYKPKGDALGLPELKTHLLKKLYYKAGLDSLACKDPGTWHAWLMGA